MDPARDTSRVGLGEGGWGGAMGGWLLAEIVYIFYHIWTDRVFLGNLAPFTTHAHFAPRL